MRETEMIHPRPEIPASAADEGVGCRSIAADELRGLVKIAERAFEAECAVEAAEFVLEGQLRFQRDPRIIDALRASFDAANKENEEAYEEFLEMFDPSLVLDLLEALSKCANTRTAQTPDKALG